MKGEFYKMEYEAWDADTEDLTIEQEGAYLRLVHQMYRRRRNLPNDIAALSRLWRCHPNKARPILKVLLDKGKIRLTEDGLLANPRVRRELDEREKLSAQRAQAGSTGGRRSADTRQTPRRQSGDTPETPRRHPGDTPHTPTRHSVDTVETEGKKPNEINASEEAIASTPTKPIQAEKRREEERRVEESKEERAHEDPDAIFREAAVASRAVEPPKDEKVYAFEAGIIRLNDRDWTAWSRAYPNLNLAGELMAMADWAERLKAEGKNWFKVLPNQLVKKDREAKEARERSRIEAESRARFMTDQAARSSRPAI